MRWVRRKIHPSWLIAAASFMIVVGVWLSQFVQGFAWPWLLLAVACAVVAFWRRRAWTLGLIVLAGLISTTPTSALQPGAPGQPPQ